MKREGTEVVGGKKQFRVEVAHAADIDAPLERVLAFGEGQVVAELRRLRLGYPGLVATDWLETCPRAEVEGWEGVGEWVLADVHAR